MPVGKKNLVVGERYLFVNRKIPAIRFEGKVQSVDNENNIMIENPRGETIAFDGNQVVSFHPDDPDIPPKSQTPLASGGKKSRKRTTKKRRSTRRSRHRRNNGGYTETTQLPAPAAPSTSQPPPGAPIPPPK